MRFEVITACKLSFVLIVPAAGLRLASPSGEKIPNEIITSHRADTIDELPPCTKQNTEQWQQKNPTYNFSYYNDKQIDEYVSKFCQLERCKEAYSKLTGGAARADLFRLVRLYTHGGTWVDSDIMAMSMKDSCTASSPSDTLLLYEYEPEHAPRYTFISASPGHPILRRTIERVIDNILTEFQHNGSLIHGAYTVTGPHNLHETICEPQFNVIGPECRKKKGKETKKKKEKVWR